jgi:iron-sulfur cluster repair protein YtfE (RIC family)
LGKIKNKYMQDQQLKNDILYDQLKDMQAENEQMLKTIKEDTNYLIDLVNNTFNTIHDTSKNFRKLAELQDKVKQTIQEIKK